MSAAIEDTLTHAIDVFSPRLFPYPTTSVLVDTNTVYRAIHFFSRREQLNDLLSLSKSHRVNLFFPEWGLSEVEEHLPEIATQTKRTIHWVTDTWVETIAPLIRIIPDVALTKPSALEADLVDPDDVPFLRAWDLLRPDWFLSTDNHIRVLDIVPEVTDERLGVLPTIIRLREYHTAEGDLYEILIGQSGLVLAGTAALYGLSTAALAIYNLLRRVPGKVYLLVALVIVGVLSL